MSTLQPTATIPDLGLTVLEAFNLARANGKRLVYSGARILIAPHIPPGYREIAIVIKARTREEA